MGPFLLVLNESFHPGWQAVLDGRQLTHVQTNGFANGWLVPALRHGTSITINFTPQRTFVFAAVISAIALAVITIMLLASLRRRAA